MLYSFLIVDKRYLSNQFDLVLMVDLIPSSREVLALQADAKRCISLITHKIDELIMNERDPLSFLLHDLVHAYKMFSNEILLKGQIGFSRAIMKIFQHEKGVKLIQELIDSDEKFSEAFDYLISDMNSHPKHLFHYFKAILINTFKNKFKLAILYGETLTEFIKMFDEFLELFEMNEHQKVLSRKMLMLSESSESATGVKHKGFNVIDFQILDDYFMSLYENKPV